MHQPNTKLSTLEVGSQNAEISSLTSIRGIAALWVVLYHYPIVVALPEIRILAEPVISAGRFAVPLFFIMSGYVLGLRYCNRLSAPTFISLLQFWWLRLGRIYPVHVSMLIAYYIVFARNGWSTQNGLSFHSFVQNCLLTQAWSYDFHYSWNYPSWSISSEWFAYLLFPALAFLTTRCSRVAILATTISCIVIAMVLYAVEHKLVFQGLAVAVPTFSGGVGLSALCPPRNADIHGKHYGEIILLMAVVLPYVVPTGPCQSAMFLMIFFMAVAFLGSAGNKAMNFWKHRILLFLGEISYSLYMTHAFTLLLWARITQNEFFGGCALQVRLGFLVMLLGSAIGAAVVMHFMVEGPMRRFSRRLMTLRKTESNSNKMDRLG